MSFDSFNIDQKLVNLLTKQGITTPSPVQAQAIPVGMQGHDVIAIAQTGTGKTLAFGLPALMRLSKGQPGRNRMLVLAPTRELACQVHKALDPLAAALGLRSTCIYGGVGMEPQSAALRRGCDIIVATPGRLLDHISRGAVRFPQLEVLVMDEADRMLDMGFLPDIRRILSGLPSDRQTMFFSATFPDEIARLTSDFQRDAKRIEVGRISTPAENVKQRLYTARGDDKVELLSKLLAEPNVTSAIVFIRTKHRTDRIAKQLTQRGIEAMPIHGGRSQGQRDRALDGFRRGRCRVLVATDVAARGIDVQGVSHVFNFDIPRTFDDYVHRIGRTGRASAKGHAVTFVCPEETKELRDIETGLGVVLDRIEWEGTVNVTSLFGSRPQPQARRSSAPGPRRGGGKPAVQGQGGGNNRDHARPAQGEHSRPAQGANQARPAQGNRNHAGGSASGERTGNREQQPQQGGNRPRFGAGRPPRRDGGRVTTEVR